MCQPCYGFKLRMEIYFLLEFLKCAVNPQWRATYFLIATDRQRLVC